MRQAIRWLRRQWHRPGKHRGDPPPPPVRPVPRHAMPSMLPGEPKFNVHETRLEMPPFRIAPWVPEAQEPEGKDSAEGECSAAVRAVRRAYAAAEAALTARLACTAPGWSR